MSRVRIVGGNITKITGGKYKIFAKDNIEFHSNKQVIQNAKDGIFHGEPEKPTEIKTDYLIKGEWRDSKNKLITKAKVGEHVKFCIETKNIPPNTPIKVELKEFDGKIYIPLIGLGYTEVRPFDDDIAVFITNTKTKETTRFTHIYVNSEGKAEFGITLNSDLDNLIAEDAGTHIELYFKCTYEGFETTLLPKSEDNYLEVKYSDRTLYLQSAAENSQYGLPEFRTADGDILIFSGNVEKVGDSSFPQEEEEKSFGDRVEEKVKEHIEEKIDEKKEETIKDLLEKSRNAIAVHQLKMKKMAFNDGVVRTRSRLYSTTSFDNAGEEFTVQRASNYGFRNRATGEVVTSRGISQLDYFRETNIYSKAAKVGLHVLECIAFLDLAKFISGNGEQGQLPGPIPALDFVIGLMLEDTKEQIKNMVDEAISTTLETAKNLGTKGINEFIDLNANDLSFSTGNLRDNKVKKYRLIDASQETLEKLLSGKIRKEQHLRDLEESTEKQDGEIYRKAGDKPFKSSLKYKIFLRTEYDEKISDNVFIVETIFIKN